MKLQFLSIMPLMLVLALSSCVILNSKKPPKDFTRSNELAHEDEALGCDLNDIICPEPIQKTPYVCRALANTPDKPEVIGWGDSPCLAKRRLMISACINYKADLLSENIDCLPDPSEGECTALSRAQSGVDEPTVCYAQEYNNRKLTYTTAIVAWGDNPSDAKYKLNLQACSEGLKPSLIGEIKCHKEENTKHCPPKFDYCQGNEVPSYCMVSKLGNQVPERPWVSVGDSECVARFNLQKIICRYNALEMLRYDLKPEAVICKEK